MNRSSRRAIVAEAIDRAERRLDERFMVISIDAQAHAGEMMVAAMGMKASGEKKLLGLRQCATENATVCTSLLEDLRERKLKTDVPTLFVLDRPPLQLGPP